MAPTTPPTLEDNQEPPEQLPAQTLGPTLDSLTTAEISQDCQDIIVQEVVECSENLVSSNARYRRKTYYNCGSCQAVLRNTTACHCGNSIDFPANLSRQLTTSWPKKPRI